MALLATNRRLFLNVNERLYPPIAMNYLDIDAADARMMNTNPNKYVLTIMLKNGKKLNVANPSNAYRDIINLEALANAINTLVKSVIK